MTGISSGVGLISGLNINSIITQLLQIESQPIRRLEQRISTIDLQRTAFATLTANILGAMSASNGFDKLNFFRKFASSSSQPESILVSAGEKAKPGSVAMTVHSLVSTHSMITKGFADKSTTPVGKGTLQIEVGKGKVNGGTQLATLLGGQGVKPGKIQITNRNGQSADIDLSKAFTVTDVINAINNAGIDVQASITGIDANGATGDRIVLQDNSGGTTSNLIVKDLQSGTMAAQLGLAANVAADRVDGANLVTISESMQLSQLNDGNGIDRLFNGTDLKFQTTYGEFDVSLSNLLKKTTALETLNSGQGVRLGTIQITDRLGAKAQVDLTGAKTAGDVIDKINGAGLAISAFIVNSQINVSDLSGLASDNPATLTIEDVDSFAATDLSIAGSNAGLIAGKPIYRVETVGDVLRAINYAPGNEQSLVKASISADGKGLSLEGLGFGNQVTVLKGDSDAAAQLGLEGASFDTSTGFSSRRLISGLNTVLLTSLNGGQGMIAGEISLIDKAGNFAAVDLSSAQTLQDVVDLINANGTGTVKASINNSGNGIQLTDNSGGSGTFTVEDASGTLATTLGLAKPFDPNNPFTGSTINGGNAQLQYVSRQTMVSQLNFGKGIGTGKFKIIDSSGNQRVISINSNITNVGQVIDQINNQGNGSVEARINDQGDGIVIVDKAGGTLPLAIEDMDGSAVATNLRVAGKAKTGQTSIDGSYEINIDVGAGDTLETLVAKLNKAGAGGFTASIFSSGSGPQPFSITLTSALSGTAGELVIDDAGLGLGLSTLTAAKDAIVTIGEGEQNMLVSSSTNKLEGIMEGVTIDLVGTSNGPVTVNVAQDVDSIVAGIGGFVSAYNEIQSTISSLTRFDQETMQRGPLFGDSTVNTVRNRLQRLFFQQFPDVPDKVNRLMNIGLKLGSNNKLEFDQEKFTNAYASDPAAVELLFTLEDKGFGDALEDMLDELSNNFDSVLKKKDDLLNKQRELLSDRIENMQLLLDRKRTRLEKQFATLESTLAGLQGQQQSLGRIQNLFAQ